MEKTRLIIVLSGTALLIYLLNKEEEKKEPEPIPLYAKIGIAGISAIPTITAAYIAGKYYFGAKHIAHELENINVSNRPMPEPQYQSEEFRKALRQEKMLRRAIQQQHLYNQYGARRIYRSREEIARGVAEDPAIGRKTPDSD